jgi:hypothetical protein
MKIQFKPFLLVGIFALFLGLQSCKESADEPIPMEVISVKFSPFYTYNAQPLQKNVVYKSPQNRDLWITKKEFYVSNVTAVSTDGKKHLIKDIALIEVDNGEEKLQLSGSIPIGNYKAISFDLGVRDDLNKADPATYAIDHPLSVTNNMYWGWSTQYIFSKLEGWEVNGSDTVSFVIHTGTTSLYRPNVSVNRTFDVVKGGTDVSVILDLFSVLSSEAYTFDLVQDGQSHTVDNLDLAIQYMDNFPYAFR